MTSRFDMRVVILLAAALALLALALAGWLRETRIERAAALPIAGRLLVALPGETLRGNSTRDNAALLAEVPLASGETVRAWLVRREVVEAEPEGLPRVPYDEDLAILYRPPAEAMPAPAVEQVLRDWFAARLEATRQAPD